MKVVDIIAMNVANLVVEEPETKREVYIKQENFLYTLELSFS